VSAFKDELGPAAAGRLADELVRAWPEFPRQRFSRGIAAALEPLELMARSNLIADRLASTLPDRFDEADAVLRRTLDSDTFAGWIVLPCGTYVSRAGADHPLRALPLLAALTPRFSSEFAIRPFIETHPRVTYEHLHRWLDEPDEHVRRLVSEGSRPRLPWAPVLRSLVADPTPNVELLDRLVDDSSAYVRRSVANHLNDIAKDHPSLALDLATRWRQRGDGAAWAVRHGLRTLVKRGDARALELVGVARDLPVEVTGLHVEERQIAIGDSATFGFTVVLAAAATEPADAVIDYRVHYQGVRGPNAPKVFKLTRRRLTPGVPEQVVRRHRFEHVSIRRIRPGPHVIDVQVNGRVLGSVTVDVQPQDTAMGAHT
jgi:3-methyladenine DNA glycosylase AlkC